MKALTPALSRKYRARGKFFIPLLLILLCTGGFTGCASHPHTALPSPESTGTRILRIGGGVIAIHDESDHAQLTPDQIDNWLQTAAHAVTNYFGKYPVSRVDITINTGAHGDEIDGVTNDGRYIHLRLPKGETVADLNDDWVATHEMFHLAFPVMPDEQKWMNEGLSTYLEPIARARIGNLSQKETWGEFVVGLPQGKPYIEDRGLNFDQTRDRIYWGGCMYWLEADIQIRLQTQNQKSLVDALLAILAAGGDGSEIWQPDKVFDIGDRATGTKVLATLFHQYGELPGGVDLDDLWKQLGVEYRDQAITFHDDAPQASIRRSITGAP